MQKEYVVCRFYKQNRHDRPGLQLQCYLGTREVGTLYVVDYHMSSIPESMIKEGAPYFCGVNQILAQNDRVAVVTVSVFEEINFSKGAFGVHRIRGQWQCELAGVKASYTFIIDKNCKKIPAATGEFWTFTLNKVVAVEGRSVVMSVLLGEPCISERAKRRRERKGQVGVAA